MTTAQSWAPFSFFNSSPGNAPGNAPGNGSATHSVLDQTNIGKKGVVPETKTEKDLDTQIAQQLNKAGGSMPRGEGESKRLYYCAMARKRKSTLCT